MTEVAWAVRLCSGGWLIISHCERLVLTARQSTLRCLNIERMRWIASPLIKQGVRNDGGSVGCVHGFVYTSD